MVIVHLNTRLKIDFIARLVLLRVIVQYDIDCLDKGLLIRPLGS